MPPGLPRHQQDGLEPVGDGDAARAAGSRPRVVIVEDNWIIAAEIEVTLAEAGYHVIGIAMSAEQAVQLCAADRPDVALMDIRLQGRRDGIDAAAELRDRYDIPSVFLTAHGEPETRRRAEPARPLGWIVKPVTGAALVRQLGEFLQAGR